MKVRIVKKNGTTMDMDLKSIQDLGGEYLHFEYTEPQRMADLVGDWTDQMYANFSMPKDEIESIFYRRSE